MGIFALEKASDESFPVVGFSNHSKIFSDFLSSDKPERSEGGGGPGPEIHLQEAGGVQRGGHH